MEKEIEKEEETFNVELVITGTISNQLDHCNMTDSNCTLGFNIRVNQFHSLDDYLGFPAIFEKAIAKQIDLQKNGKSINRSYDINELDKYTNKGEKIIYNIEYVRLFPDNLNMLETIQNNPFIQRKKIVLPIFREQYTKEVLEDLKDVYKDYINNIYVMTCSEEADKKVAYVRIVDLLDKIYENEGPVKTLGTIDKNRK